MKPISECQYNERLKTKVEGSTCLSDLDVMDGPSIIKYNT
jgi:hypothetical protein